VVLNHAVGGLNVEAVRACSKFGGKIVWLPSMDAAQQYRSVGKKGGIEVLTKKGEVLPELKEILGIIADEDMVFSTSHTSTYERFVLIDEARKIGVKKIHVDHPQLSNVRATVDQLAEMAKKGAYISICYCSAIPNFLYEMIDPTEVVEIIRKVGPEHCIGSTDVGQIGNPHPVDAMRLFFQALLLMGVSKQDIEIIFKKKPAELLALN